MDAPPAPPSPRPLSEQEQVRRQKLETLRAQGIDPYPSRFERSHLGQELQDRYRDLANGEETQDEVRVAGRITGRRESGKLVFIDLTDGSGKLQLFLSLDKIGETAFERLALLDLGDFVGATGTIRRTKRGELSVAVGSWQLLSKALRPMPEKWHGLSDVEQRYRQRYLDLMANPEVKETFVRRTRAIQAIRRFLDARGFMEVETPMLQAVPGGAAARPFLTHHNALDLELHLRISPELYLKRLVVGGFERVYEINRNFRNEGISTRHNPEFTMLEVYQAYADYQDMMQLTEELVAYVAQEVLGGTRLTYQGHEIDLSPPWPRMTMEEALTRHFGEDVARWDLPKLEELARRHDVPAPGKTRGKLVNALFEHLVDSTLMGPVFIVEHPVEVSPLAKRKASAPELTERFEGFVAGRELLNAFSELNDPLDQRGRFEAQLLERRAGDEEAHRLDEDFLTALEHGLPPTGGLGIGIDRLVMLLTDAPSIRDVVLFPLLRPRD